jgi:hypothetical protein
MGGTVDRGRREPHSVRPTLERRVVARCATRSHQLRSLLRTQKRAHRVRPPSGGVRCWRSNSVHAIPALMPALSCEDHDTRELSLYRASYSGLHNGCHPKRSAALRLRSGQALRNAVEGSMLIQRRWYRAGPSTALRSAQNDRPDTAGRSNIENRAHWQCSGLQSRIKATFMMR